MLPSRKYICKKKHMFVSLITENITEPLRFHVEQPRLCCVSRNRLGGSWARFICNETAFCVWLWERTSETLASGLHGCHMCRHTGADAVEWLVIPGPRFPLARTGTLPWPLPGGLATSRWWTPWRWWPKRPWPQLWVVDATACYPLALKASSWTAGFPRLWGEEPCSSTQRLSVMLPDAVTSLMAISKAKLSFLIFRKIKNTKNTFYLSKSYRVFSSIES